MNSSSIILLVFSAFAVVAFLRFARARRLINEWAESENLQICRRIWQPWLTGPFLAAPFGSQLVYHLVVRDATGKERRCWVKCGDWWLGLLSSKFEVAWQPEGSEDYAHRRLP